MNQVRGFSKNQVGDYSKLGDHQRLYYIKAVLEKFELNGIKSKCFAYTCIPVTSMLDLVTTHIEF